MEDRKTEVPKKLKGISVAVICVLSAAWVCFLLITIFAKPAYGPWTALGIIEGAMVLLSIGALVILVTDYQSQEGNQ